MKLIITNDKEIYLANCYSLTRPKLLNYQELLKLVYSDISNSKLLDSYGYEYKNVLLKNIMFVTKEVNSELYELKQNLGININSLQNLKHYNIEVDFLLDKVLLDMLPNYNLTFEETKVESRDIIESVDMLHECQFIVNEVARLINDGHNINDIKVIVPNDIYKNTMILYFSMNNINYKVETNINICTKDSVKKLLNSNDIEELITLSQIIEDNTIKNKVIGIINQNTSLLDIKQAIKKATVKYITINDAIEISGVKEYQNNIVIVAGVYNNSYNLSVKDNDFYTDDEKQKLGLKTSLEKTKENIARFNKIINKAHIITKPHSDINGEVKPYFEFNTISNKNIYKYSKNTELVNMVNYNNLKVLYGEIAPRMELIDGSVELTKDKKFNYQKYSMDLKIRSSASNIEMYNKCSFSFYLRYVLKLKAKKLSTWNLNLGTFTHHILEYGYTNDDIEEEVIRYLNKVEYDDFGNEIVLFDLVEKKIIINMIPFLIKLVNHTKNQFYSIANLELEKEIKSNDINLIGYIDKYINHENEFMILDYKTGNAKMNFDFMHYGIEMQNMLYAYIIEKENPALRLKGTFRQKAKPIVMNHDKDFIKEYNINGKLDQNNIVDYDFVSIQRKKSGEIYSNKLLKREHIEEYYTLIEDNISSVRQAIKDNEFAINPKKHKAVVDACKYCDYAEVCYKTVDDYVLIDKYVLKSEKVKDEI